MDNIDKVTNEVSTLINKLNELKSATNTGGLKHYEQDVMHAEKELSEIIENLDKFANNPSDVVIKVDLESNIEDYKSFIDSLIKNVNRFGKSFDEIKKSMSLDEAIERYEDQLNHARVVLKAILSKDTNAQLFNNEDGNKLIENYKVIGKQLKTKYDSAVADGNAVGIADLGTNMQQLKDIMHNELETRAIQAGVIKKPFNEQKLTKDQKKYLDVNNLNEKLGIDVDTTKAKEKIENISNDIKKIGIDVDTTKAKEKIENISNDIKKIENKHSIPITANYTNETVNSTSRINSNETNSNETNSNETNSRINKNDLKTYRDNINQLDSEFNKVQKDADKAGTNVDKIIQRINAVKNGAQHAFNAGNIEQTNVYMQQYNNLISQMRDKVNGATKAQEMGAQRQAEAMRNLLAETKSYVSTQEALTGKKMSYSDQVAYYTQQLPKFTSNSKEYIDVLKLKRQAEENDANAATKAQEMGAQRQAEAMRNLLAETKSYVSTQEALTGKKMSYSDQVAYYTQQLPKFASNSKEYIDVLRLKRQAEENDANAAKKAAEDTSNAAKSRSQQITNRIRQITSFINNAVSKIISIIRTGINITKKVFDGIGSIYTTTKSVIEKIMTLFSNFGNRIKQAFGISDNNAKGLAGSFNILKGSAMELYAKIQMITMAYNVLFNGALMQNVNTLYGSIYTLKTIIGTDLTTNTINWANNLQHAFGLNAKSMISDMRELATVLYGLGMSAKDTQLGAENLTIISRYLALLGGAGGDVNEVMSKIVSGMKGMTQSVDDLGISVKENDMNAYLKSLKAQGGEYANIATNFTNLTEQAKVYVRYSAIVAQVTTKYKLTDTANALNTITGRITLMKEEIKELGYVLGQGFMQILSALAPYITYAVSVAINGINSLMGVANKLFGLNLSTDLSAKMNDTAESGKSLADSANDTADGLNNAANAATTAKNSLAGFDKITSVTKNSTNGTLGTDPFDYTKLMNSALNDLNNLANKQTESAMDKIGDKVKSKFAQINESIQGWIKEKSGRPDFNLEFNKDDAKKSLSEILTNIKDTIKASGNFVISLGLKIADDLNLGKILNKILSLIDAVTKFASTLTEKLSPVLLQIYEDWISPFVKQIGDAISDKLDKWTDSVKKATDIGSQFAEVLGLVMKKDPLSIDEAIKIEGFEKAHPILYNFIEDIKNVVTNLGFLKEMLKNGSVFTGESLGILGLIIGGKLGGAGGAAAGGILGFIFGSAGADQTKQVLQETWTIIKELADIIKDLFDQLSKFVKNEIIPWLIAELKEIGDWIKNNKAQIEKFIDIIAKFAWDSFKLFIDALEGLIKLAVEHPNAFKALIVGLAFTKVATGIAGITSSIINLITQAKLLKALGGIGVALKTGGATATGVAGGVATGEEVAGAAAGGSLISKIGGGVKKVGTGIGSAAKAVGGGVVNTAGAVGKAAKTGASAVGNGAKNAASAVGNGAKNAASAVGNGAKSVGSFVSDSGVLTGNGLSTTAGTVMASASIVAGLAMATKDAVNGVKKSTEWLGQEKGNTTAGKIESGTGAFIGGTSNGINDENATTGQKIGSVAENAGKWGAIGAGIGSIIPGAGTLAGLAVGSALGGITGAIGGKEITNGLSTAFDNIKAAASATGTWISDRFNDASVLAGQAVATISTTATSAWDVVKTGVSDTGTWIGDQFNNAGQAIGNVAANIGTTVSGAWDVVKTGVSDTGTWIGSTFDSAGQVVGVAATTIGTTVSGAWDTVKTGASNAGTWIGSTFENARQGLSGTFNNIQASAGSAWNNIQTGASSAWSNVLNSANSLSSSLSSVWEGVKSSAGSMFDTIKSWASDAWSSVTSGVSSAWNSVTSRTTSHTSYSIDRVPNIGHANGGSVKSGQVFVANENGVPEIVGNIGATTAVANNSMIIEAMRQAVYESSYNALADVVNQLKSNKKSNSGVNKIDLNGAMLINETNLRQLAAMLGPYMNASNTDYADLGFSLS